MATKKRSESPDIVLLSDPSPNLPSSRHISRVKNMRLMDSDDVTIVEDIGTPVKVPRQKTREKDLRNELRAVKKENEGLRAECAAGKAEIERLRRALQLFQTHKKSVKPDPAVAGKDDKTQVKTPKVKVKRESKSKIIKREEKVVVSEGEQMHSDNENQDPNDCLTAPAFREAGLNFSDEGHAFELGDVDADGQNASAGVDEVPSGSSRDRSSNAATIFRDEIDEPTRSPTPVLVKREWSPALIEVKVKVEDRDDELKHVFFTKSEDGMLDIWNLDGFGLGLEIQVAELFNKGWTRKEISDALGGGHQACFHNWYSDATLAKKAIKEKTSQKEPFVTFNREWNPQLPTAPGQHGVVFCGLQHFDDKTKVNKPITFFVRESTNNWRQLGEYCVKRWGEISPKHLNLLPPTMITVWVNGALDSEWGKRWVEHTNDDLVKQAKEDGTDPNLVEYTDEGMRTALIDGRLIISFTIMECVGYRQDWHDRLEHYRQHPKPPKTKSKRKGSESSGNQARGRKVAKGKGSRKIVKEESEAEDSDADYGSENDAEDVEDEDARRNRKVTKLPKRRRSKFTE